MVRILIAAFATVLLAAGPARAEVRVVRAPVGPIQLAGRAVVYEERTSSIEDADVVEYDDRIVRRVPGRARHVVAEPASSIDSNFEGGYDDLRWDVSSAALLTGVGFTNYEAASSDGGVRILGGLLGQPSTRFSKCNVQGEPDTPSVAVWGKLAAYADTCDSRDRAVVVRRVDRPHDAPLFTHPGGDSEVDLAGNYVAISYYGDADAVIEVYDWRDGKLLYRVTADIWADQARAGTFELQQDGKLATVLVGRGDFCEAAWYSPADPTPHVLGHTACGADVRLSGDRLAWMRIGKRRGELVVTPLGGPGRAVVRFPAVPPPPKRDLYSETTASQSFAWDGRRLAYAIARCDGRSTLLLRRHVDRPVRRDRHPRSCPLHIGARVLYVKRGSKRVGVPFTCVRGCSGTMAILGSHPSIEEPFALRAGRSRYARLYLDRDTLAGLSDHGTASIRLRVDSEGRIGGTRHEVPLRLYAR